MAELSATKMKLVGTATIENRQLFESKPILSNVERLINAFDEPKYDLRSTNTWSLPYLIQESLGVANRGYFTLGSAFHSEERVQFLGRVTPFPPGSIGTASTQRGYPATGIETLAAHQQCTATSNSTVEEILHQFREMDHGLRKFCDRCAEHIDHSRPPPIVGARPEVAPRGNALVGVFPSVKDDLFFTMLSIMNREIYNRIFLPLHPALSDDEAAPHRSQMRSVCPADEVVARAAIFRDVDSKTNADRLLQHRKATTRAIQSTLLGAVRGLADESSLPHFFMNDLANIVQAACEWNQMIKTNVGRCAFAPFLVESSSVWDPDRMESESFERLRVPVQSGSQIISPISLGVLGSVTRDGGMSRSLYVQQKAQVLVNEPTNRKQRRAMKFAAKKLVSAVKFFKRLFAFNVARSRNATETRNLRLRTTDTPELPAGRAYRQSTPSPARSTVEAVINERLSSGPSSMPSVPPPESFHSPILPTIPLSLLRIPEITLPLHPLPTQQPARMIEADSGDSLGDNRSTIEEDDGIKDSKAFICSAHLSQLLDLQERPIHSLRGREAAELGSKLYSYLATCSDPIEYTGALKLLQNLCSSSGELPSCFKLENVTFNRGDVVGKGGEVSVYAGSLGGNRVVVREVVMPRQFWCSPDGRETIKLIHREVITHSRLQHPNIIPFLGVYNENANVLPPMVIVPFMEKGSLSDLLRHRAIKGVAFAWIITGIGRALMYLHSRMPQILHGDIHPGNILIDSHGNAILCDFGFSRIRHECTRSQSNIREGGRPRFLAPELLDGASEVFRTTSASDIFSLSMTFLSVWTRKIPFPDMKLEKAKAAIVEGLRPNRPGEQIDLPPKMEQEFWLLIVRMWACEASDRPSSKEMQEQLEMTLRPLLEQHESENVG